MSTRVLILMGSDSDFPAMSAAVDVLDQFGVSSACHVASAHRSPKRVQDLLHGAEADGAQVVICAAGMAAHLAGVVASKTLLPVLGVPLEGGPGLAGVDALYSTVMMPPGIPVGTLAIGKPGARNAAYLALAILSLSDTALRKRLGDWRAGLESAVAAADEKVQTQLAQRKKPQ
jgi:phosphoribosylaminoimidazole carboxylase PurE protein